jgi:hypothetical protein
MKAAATLPPYLQWPLDACRQGAITREQAVACVKAWNACLPVEMALKARALRALATAPTADTSVPKPS